MLYSTIGTFLSCAGTLPCMVLSPLSRFLREQLFPVSRLFCGLLPCHPFLCALFGIDRMIVTSSITFTPPQKKRSKLPSAPTDRKTRSPYLPAHLILFKWVALQPRPLAAVARIPPPAPPTVQLTMIEPDWPTRPTKEEWSAFSHFGLPTLNFPENPQPVVDAPPAHLGYWAMAAANDPPVYSALREFTQGVDSMTDALGKLELYPSAIPSPTFGQWHPSPTIPHSLPPDNELLPISAVHFPFISAPMSSADSGPALGGFWDCFIRRDRGGSVCTWSDSPDDVCGYRSRFTLVKRHVKRVHFGERYDASVTNRKSL